MTEYERIAGYIHSLESGEGTLLDGIEREARLNHVPIVKRETAALLKVLTVVKRPRSILEIGTAVGYSTLLMCRVMPADCRITTIENYSPRIAAARENFRRAGQEERITLLEGDAGELLKLLSGPYDMIFMDAAKGQYINWLPEIIRLLEPEGVLISDNVFQDGDIVQSRYSVERRNRTIHARMREYLYELTHSRRLLTSIIPIGDGVALSVRQQGERGHT